MTSFSYDITRSYDWNYEHGPVLSEPVEPVPSTPTKSFLGHSVGSRFGIAAGLL